MIISVARPVIGVTCYREPARYGAWRSLADLLPSDYARSVEAAGGVVVLLPPLIAGSAAAAVVARVDGLVVSGGPDIHPGRYAAAAHASTRASSPERDAWDLDLLDAAASVDLPVLGICRGMQMMAVHAGGGLHQHVPDRVGHQEHSPGPGAYGWTSVTTVEGSAVRRLVGAQVQVSCHHHQAVADHPGFTATAYAADQTVEAIEDDRRAYWVGVQWHPENGDDHGLFRGLVAAAAERATRDAGDVKRARDGGDPRD